MWKKRQRNVRELSFVEDEVTTGNTIGKIVQILKERYPGKFQYSVASVLNGMKGGRPEKFLRFGNLGTLFGKDRSRRL